MPKSKLSDAEFEILKVLWDNKEATVTEISHIINEKLQKNLTRNTIQVQLRRLIAKEWVQRHERDGKYYFSPTVSEEESCGEIAVDIKNRVFGGSIGELVKCLFESDDISDNDIAELEEILADKKRKKA